MSGFFRALTGNDLRTRGKRRSSRLAERKHGLLGARRLQMESLEARQLLSITLPTIANVTLPAGTTMFVPLAGSDPGQTVKYAVTASDYKNLTPVMMPQTNQTLEFKVNINGADQVMDFQLFDNLTPVTTAQIESLVNSGYYNGLEIYRNGKDGSGNPFVIQGGNDPPDPSDPTTTSPIKADQSPIDDEFNPNLQFTTVGGLGMARSTPGTASTEFFVTENATDGTRQSLDYNYTLFGVQTSGSSVISTIAALPNDPNNPDYLATPLTITSARIFTDLQNGVLELSAPTGVKGTVTVTVTASDGTNAPVTQTFNVTIAADSPSNPANPFASVIPTAPTSVTFVPPTGGSSQVTNLNNSSDSSTLQFQVTGVTAGNVVEILADGNPIGQGVASDTSSIVTTDGSTTLTDGLHKITAIQIAPGQTVDVTESGGTTATSQTADVPSLNSPSAQLTVATTAPALTVELSLPTISEGDGTKADTGIVTVAVAPTSNLVVNLASSNNAQATVDPTVTILAGQTSSAPFAINAVDDGILETAASNLTITASATGYKPGTAPLTVNNIDVANTLTLQIDNTTFAENAGAGAATGTVTRTGPTNAALTVTLSSSDTTAATVPATVTIPAGQISATFPITAVDDHVIDAGGARPVTITATAPNYTFDTDATSGTKSNTKTVTVIDMAQTLTLQIDNTTFAENAGAGAATGTVTRTGPTDADLTVTLNSSDTTSATVPATVTIPAGQSSATFPLSAVDDHAVDGTKTVTITATAPNYTFNTTTDASGAKSNSNAKTVTVLDSEALPTLSINDVTNSNDSGKDGFVFTVTLSAPSAEEVTVQYATVNGTATAGSQATAGSDYHAESGTLTIPAGQTSGKITVPVYGDWTLASDKTFFVVLSNAATATTIVGSNGTVLIPATLAITDPQGTGTILPAGATVTDPPAPTATTSPATTTPDTTVAMYDSATGTWFLRNSNSTGVADTTFTYGPALNIWKPITGDWDHNGTVTVGLYNSATSTFYLRNSNTTGVADVTFQYGPANANWVPITGDWDNDGTTTVGLYNAATSTFYLRNSNTTGFANVTFQYGPVNSTWTPITGHWNGTGATTVGLYDAGTGLFYLRNSNTTGVADTTFQYGPPDAGWTPITGDWGGTGATTIGLYNPGNSFYYLRNTNTTGVADTIFTYGLAVNGWVPITGDWNGPGNAALAAGGAVTASANVPVLTQADLQPIISQAIARWRNAGLDAAAVAKLTQARFVISDLPGSYLGEDQGNLIQIDGNAAGYGWFVDPTPASDAEFTASSVTAQLQAVDPRAIDRMDLLTVVEHELGHALGLSDLASSANDLMSRTLSAGVRRNATDADAVFADHGSWL